MGIFFHTVLFFSCLAILGANYSSHCWMWALFAGSVYVCEDRWLISLKSLAESKMAPWMAKKTNLTAQPTTNLTCCHSQEAQTNCFAAGRDSSLVLVMSLPSIWKSHVLWSNLPYTCSSLQLPGFCCATAIQLGWRLDLDWAIRFQSFYCRFASVVVITVRLHVPVLAKP